MEKTRESVSQPKKTAKEYVSPKVVTFGKVRELTTGGSSGGSENGTNMGGDPLYMV